MKLPGWKQINAAVWQHVSGTRLHVAGLCLIRGVAHWANMWPESAAADRCIRIAGGNRKRGLMLWASRKESES